MWAQARNFEIFILSYQMSFRDFNVPRPPPCAKAWRGAEIGSPIGTSLRIFIFYTGSLVVSARFNINCCCQKNTGVSGMRFPHSLRPFSLLQHDLHNLRLRYTSDWTVFNQLVVASAVYVFFTNLLPGITFASDLYVLTGKSWGTIEVVFSTGLCGVIFSLWV